MLNKLKGKKFFTSAEDKTTIDYQVDINDEKSINFITNNDNYISKIRCNNFRFVLSK